MDIIIRINPRIIERIVFILIIIGLVTSNIYLYNKIKCPTTKEISEEATEEQGEVIEAQEKEESPENKTTETKKNETTATTTATGPCTAGWKCKTPYYKGYQNADCSWMNGTLEACVNGCIDGQCNLTARISGNRTGNSS